jgi:hypothetical protein
MRQQWVNEREKNSRENYGPLWRQATGEWRENQGQDAFWLTAHASYLFSTRGVRWAMDLSFIPPGSSAIWDQVAPTVLYDLKGLRFVVYTRWHYDHLDMRLLEALKDSDVKWLLPDFFPQTERYWPCVKPENIIWMREGVPVCVDGITITPFSNRQSDYGLPGGVPQYGYIVDAGAKRLLFPGDVRAFEPERIPHPAGVSHLFAHVWLGRGCALEGPSYRYLADYGAFVHSFGAERIHLTHIAQWTSNDLSNWWCHSHAGAVMDHLLYLNFRADVNIPLLGKKALL